MTEATKRCWWKRELTLPVWGWFLIAWVCMMIHDFIIGFMKGLMS